MWLHRRVMIIWPVSDGLLILEMTAHCRILAAQGTLPMAHYRECPECKKCVCFSKNNNSWPLPYLVDK